MLDDVEVVGASAKCLVAHLRGVGRVSGDYPHDADDFARCEAVIERFGLRSRIDQMASVNAYWRHLAPRWEEIRTSADISALIASIVRPIEDADPGCVRMGIASIRAGGVIDFQGEAKMKETDADRAVRDKAYAVTADELRQFIERFEQLEAEKKDVVEQQKELLSEAKGRGYDGKVMKKVIALRKRKPDDIAEEEAILDMYKSALGMS